jgi:SAM-dependent methyltransferase
MNACKICGNTSGNKTHTAREMMFGLRDKFEYLECGNCGCVQLVNVPSDMAKYYPPNYYSFQKHGWAMTQLRRRWAAYACGASSLAGWFVTELICPNNAMTSVHRLKLPKSAKILDVGCGSGKLLQDLHYFGYSQTSGADPFIEKDIVYEKGPTIFKKQLSEMAGPYDVIMLHHAFEHMDQPAETLQVIARLLSKEGRAIIRIPVASSYGWRHYGINWVHLDAPRHLFLHTFKSMEILSGKAGLEIADTIHEAEELSISGSESYVKDIPLTDPRYPLSSSKKRLMAWNRRKADKVKAQELNQRQEADMICFYLKKRV